MGLCNHNQTLLFATFVRVFHHSFNLLIQRFSRNVVHVSHLLQELLVVKRYLLICDLLNLLHLYAHLADLHSISLTLLALIQKPSLVPLLFFQFTVDHLFNSCKLLQERVPFLLARGPLYLFSKTSSFIIHVLFFLSRLGVKFLFNLHFNRLQLFFLCDFKLRLFNQHVLFLLLSQVSLEAIKHFIECLCDPIDFLINNTVN